LLIVLRANAIIAERCPGTIPVDEELRCFDDYMRNVRGLAPKTRSMALRTLRRLLLDQSGDAAGRHLGDAAGRPAPVHRRSEGALQHTGQRRCAGIVFMSKPTTVCRSLSARAGAVGGVV
jgi:integrase/recombinase XerC